MSSMSQLSMIQQRPDDYIYGPYCVSCGETLTGEEIDSHFCVTCDDHSEPAWSCDVCQENYDSYALALACLNNHIEAQKPA